MALPSPPIAQQGGDIDVDQLYRRIALLESRSQDSGAVVITGGTMTGVKARIRDSRLQPNMYNSGYLQPAPAWAATTVYANGQAVTANGGTYMCTNAVNGTSGSTAPSATTPAPITDGTVNWYYFGPAPSTDASAPTMTAGATTPGGFTASKLGTDTSWYDILGGTYTMGADGPGWSNSVEPINAGGMAVEWMTDSTDFIMQWKFGAAPVRVTVDGKLVSPSAYVGAGTFRLRIAFPAGMRKSRRITAYWSGGNSFAGVLYAPTDRFWKVPAPIQSFNLFTVGDSYFGGSSYHPCAPDRAPHHMLAEMLGARQFQRDGVGGSGYTVPGSGTVFGSATRLARIPAGQDVIVVAGGINDAAAGLQAAVQSYLQSLRALQPNALIFVTGPWAGNLGPDANALTKEAAIQAAVTAVADSKIIFVPVNTDATGAWFYGTGKVDAQNSTGNADLYVSPDGTHPVCPGAEYLMGRLADAIRAQIRPALN